MSRREVLTLSLAALGVAAGGALFCALQIFRTTQIPAGDGSGMQWVILTPLALIFGFIVVPALMAGVRGLRLLQSNDPPEVSRSFPVRGWLIALGLLSLYFLAPFVVAPILDMFMGE